MDTARSFVSKYVLASITTETKGFVCMTSMNVNSGLALWKSGDQKKYLIVRIPILLCLGFYVSCCILVDHLTKLGHTNWFNTILNYNYCLGQFSVCLNVLVRQRKIVEISESIDLWWNYSFLEEEQAKMKERLYDRLRRFLGFYYKFMLVGAACYSMVPVGRYFYDGDGDPKKLLMFESWSPLPLSTWWGFGVAFVAGLIIVLSMFGCFTFSISYLITSMETIGCQMELVGLSLVTAEERALKGMAAMEVKQKDGKWDELYVAALQKELANSARHYQKLYRLSKELCALFPAQINLIFLIGMIVLVICCAKMITEKNNQFLVFQSFVMVSAVLMNQFIISWINQILADQVEKLRVTVYDSPWYQMPVRCRKAINIFQVMVANPPSIRTILGAKVDMEFFTSIVNASYFYIGALLSLNQEF